MNDFRQIRREGQTPNLYAQDLTWYLLIHRGGGMQLTDVHWMIAAEKTLPGQKEWQKKEILI